MKLYYTIQEAAQIVGVKPHILRYWEGELANFRVQRRRGRRLYTPEDLKRAMVVRNLLYKEGYTLNGAKKRIQEGSLKNLIKESGSTLVREITQELETILRTIKDIKETLKPP